MNTTNQITGVLARDIEGSVRTIKNVMLTDNHRETVISGPCRFIQPIAVSPAYKQDEAVALWQLQNVTGWKVWLESLSLGSPSGWKFDQSPYRSVGDAIKGTPMDRLMVFQVPHCEAHSQGSPRQLILEASEVYQDMAYYESPNIMYFPLSLDSNKRPVCRVTIARRVSPAPSTPGDMDTACFEHNLFPGAWVGFWAEILLPERFSESSRCRVAEPSYLDNYNGDLHLREFDFKNIRGNTKGIMVARRKGEMRDRSSVYLVTSDEYGQTRLYRIADFEAWGGNDGESVMMSLYHSGANNTPYAKEAFDVLVKQPLFFLNADLAKTLYENSECVYQEKGGVPGGSSSSSSMEESTEMDEGPVLFEEPCIEEFDYEYCNLIFKQDAQSGLLSVNPYHLGVSKTVELFTRGTEMSGGLLGLVLTQGPDPKSQPEVSFMAKFYDHEADVGFNMNLKTGLPAIEFQQKTGFADIKILYDKLSNSTTGKAVVDLNRLGLDFSSEFNSRKECKIALNFKDVEKQAFNIGLGLDFNGNYNLAIQMDVHKILKNNNFKNVTIELFGSKNIPAGYVFGFQVYWPFGK